MSRSGRTAARGVGRILPELRRNVEIYRLALRDPRTPRRSRWLLGFALAYLLSPIDLVPDFLPVVGHLDDLWIVPGLIALALRWIPPEVLEECRSRAGGDEGCAGVPG